ncbi:MAG TPA: discoidin domain-containing protein [Polyangiaceae bacterium]|jgi:hypothetical protein
MNRIVSWLWVSRDAWAEARQAAERVTSQQLESAQRAERALRFAERGLSPDSHLPDGEANPPALELYRQSSYWALLSARPELAGPPAQVWDAPANSSDSPNAARPSERAREILRADFTSLWELPASEQTALARELREFTNEQLLNARRPLREFARLRARRFLTAALAAIVLLTAFGLLALKLSQKPDLARGKPWTTSSTYAHCHPELSECGGATTKIFFHTNDEMEPWFRYDFGAPLRFSSLTIRNRADFGAERAVPLIVEVSDDGERYQEVARRSETFDTWNPAFAPQTARFLRLRVARQSMLHLETVEVHP